MISIRSREFDYKSIPCTLRSFSSNTSMNLSTRNCSFSGSGRCAAHCAIMPIRPTWLGVSICSTGCKQYTSWRRKNPAVSESGRIFSHHADQAHVGVSQYAPRAACNKQHPTQKSISQSGRIFDVALRITPSRLQYVLGIKQIKQLNGHQNSMIYNFIPHGYKKSHAEKKSRTPREAVKNPE